MRALGIALVIVLGAALAGAGCGDSDPPDPSDGSLTDGRLLDAPAVDAAGQARVTGTGPEGLNMRDGPGAEFTVIRVIPEGQVVDVLGGPENTTWWNVAYEGYVGWCSGDFLEFL